MKITKILTIVLSLIFVLATATSVLATLESSVVHNYAFDDNYLDSLGTCNLTNSGTSLVSGIVNNSADFERSNSDYISSTSCASLQSIGTSSDIMAIRALVKPESTGIESTFFSQWYSGGNKILMRIESSNAFGCYVADGGTKVATSTTNIVAGTVYDFGCIYDGTNIKVYINGVQDGSSTAYSDIPEYTGDSMIGAKDNLAGSNYDGLGDELVYWDGYAPTPAEMLDLHNGGDYKIYCADSGDFQTYTDCNPVPSIILSNFSTVETGSFSFDSPVTIGAAYGIVNSLTFNNTVIDSEPFYFASSLTVYNGPSTALCRITIDGVSVASTSRTLTAGNYGNVALVSPADNLSLGEHIINTECRKVGGSNYVVENSQLSQFLLYDTNSNSTITRLAFEDAGPIAINTVDSNLGSFSFTTSNTTNTTNNNFLVTQGVVNYNYDVEDNITTYFKIEETGEVCGPYTRGGNAGSVGSIGASCLFTNLSSSTTYNLSLYGYTELGTGSLTNLASNLYEVQLNTSAANITTLNKVVPPSTLTLVDSVNINNILGGDFNVFSQASIMVNSDVSQDAYFYLSNSVNTSSFYRTLSSDGKNGNIVIQNVFSESGVVDTPVSLYAYCPSGCTISGGSLNAFITDASTVSTGLFNITAYNTWNSTPLTTFNVTIGGSTQSTTTGYVEAIGQGNINVVIEASGYFSNTTLHDTTTDLNASLSRYTLINANTYGGGAISNFTLTNLIYSDKTDEWRCVYLECFNTSTTNGIAYFPVSSTNTSVTINGESIALQTDLINKTETYTFEVYAENSLLITFKDSETDSVINNVDIEYFSTLDSDTETTTNGTMYLTLLNPVTYTFRINSSTYDDALYFTTITDDSFAEFTVYLNPTASTTTITVEVVDGGASPVSNAQVKALKYYVDDNTYRVVASGITNPDGETNVDLVTGTNFYKFVVVVEDEVVKTTEPFIITGTTVRIQVLLGDAILEDYNTWRSIDSTLVFNPLTTNFRLDYTDNSNVNREVCMNTYLSGYSTDTIISSSCVTGTSGTILGASGNTTGATYYAKATTTINGLPVIIASESYTFPDLSIGTGGLILQIMLTIVMSLAGFIAIELLFIMAPLSIIIGGIAHLHNIALTVTIPLLIVGIIIMFLLKRNQ